MDLPRRLREGVEFSRGDKIRVKIPVNGYPKPEIAVEKDGVLLRPEGRVEISQTDSHVTLQIYSGKNNDGGEYTIKAKNNAGSERKSFKITVIGEYKIFDIFSI